MVTWRELKSFIETNVDSEWIDCPIAIHLEANDEFHTLTRCAMTYADDVLTEGEPFLVLDVTLLDED
jgi:hypothetical protein